ncbi:EF-hand domain-containing protein [Kibdelosporangium phytohabitans]|uniref:Histidine kinase n=1 Tax=Kibdelosporangium phytohabitans TaxID=860235 RepID=A0A0N9HZN4_9PSEU|nr:EF-hand domain-containing protein [Kibdelosporangium phytohabitans]ALG12794.1 histidine kinase [Kibdelosporangium phytohabitans]MBE1464474.1 Ca2+-binding EF-hand superfamily protein [Kibdelosporangium phytohabitans]
MVRTGADFLSAKISRGFDMLDADGNGVLDEDDHVAMGKRSAEALGHSAGSPEQQRIVDVYLRIWREVHLPHLPPGQTAIGREEFIAATAALAGDPAAARATLGAVASAFLEIADIDSDGRITPAEFRTFQHAHFPELSRADADIAFAHLDVDGDGCLTPGEFVDATIGYWTTTDPDAPANWWLGPIRL